MQDSVLESQSWAISSLRLLPSTTGMREAYSHWQRKKKTHGT